MSTDGNLSAASDDANWEPVRSDLADQPQPSLLGTNAGRPGRETRQQKQFAQELSRLAWGSLEPNTRQQFHQLVRHRLGVLSSVEVDFDEAEAPSLAAEWSTDKLDAHPAFREELFRVAAQARRQGSVQVARPEGYDLTMVCVPIPCSNDVGQVWAVVLPLNVDAVRAGRQLRVAAEYYAIWQTRRQVTRLDGQLSAMETVVDLVYRLHGCGTLDEGCQVLVNEAAKLPGTTLVAVAVQANNGLLRLAAISGAAQETTSGPGTADILAACQEALLHERGARWTAPSQATSFPVAEAATLRSRAPMMLAHQHAGQQLGLSSVTTFVLNDADAGSLGVLLLAGEPTSGNSVPAERILAAAVPGVTAGLHQLRRLQPGFVARCATWLGGWLRGFRAALLMLGLASVVATLCVPLPYQVRGTCVVEPATRRFAVAPFAGIVRSGNVSAGQLVTAGQPLATMDAREIGLQLASVQAEQQRAATQRNVHLADQAVPAAIMAELEHTSLASRREILQRRELAHEIKAPLDGYVLSGDWQHRQNEPVQQGQILYEIGSVGSIRIQIHVPAEDIRHVKVGQAASVRLAGFAHRPLTGQIATIHARSQAVAGRNVFVAELELPNPEAVFRPGMRGHANISTDRRALAWNLFHKPYEYLVGAFRSF